MLRETTESLPQRLLVTLLADYRTLMDGPVPSRVLVDVFRDFDISSDALRSALSRLVKRDILEREKDGRATSYVLTDHALTMIKEDTDLILNFGADTPWDGVWTLVAFSVAESVRERRHVLRTQLRGIGFAPLYDGLWVGAHATEADARHALDTADVHDWMVFRGAPTESTPLEQFHSAWKLDEIADEYRRFIAMTVPLADAAERGQVPPAEALVARTRVMDGWRVFPRKDPNLPAQLLPAPWPLREAHGVFHRAYNSLKPAAEARLTQIMHAHASS